jgi:hypothetical protein
MRHQNASWHIRRLSKPTFQAVIFVTCLMLMIRKCKIRILFDGDTRSLAKDRVCSDGPAVSSRVLVSYSYFQKDDIQAQNLEFFMEVGMGISSGFQPPNYTDFVIVINGAICDPCYALLAHMDEDPRYKNLRDINKAWSSADVAVLQRRENEGMDFAAHNVGPSSHACCPFVHSRLDVHHILYAACMHTESNSDISGLHTGHHEAVTGYAVWHGAQNLLKSSIRGCANFHRLDILYLKCR